MKEFVDPLEKALGRVQDAALFVMQNAMKNHDEAGAAASDLLRLMALTAMAFMWAASPSLPTRAWPPATTTPSTKPSSPPGASSWPA